ncbi:B12-binding domain-containing radical SAM protein [Candidatus Woesearchaeota archaeon]|nr:B12-binding domain-containing radical SAM protein [Candidatus Woesearchaeota archaeon]
MKVVLINPPLIGQKGDIFGSIPSIPTGVAFLAAYLRDNKVDVSIIDAFGLKPRQVNDFLERFEARGLTVEEIVNLIPTDTDIVGISVHSGVSHTISLRIIEEIRKCEPLKHIKVVLGGMHATTLYNEFVGHADYVVLGEAEESLLELVRGVEGKKRIEEIDGIAYKKDDKLFVKPKTRFINDLDSLPFPAIDLLPLENYWKIGSAHGPTSGKYLFLITSRGCWYNCNFCGNTSFWKSSWRFRSANNVVDEMEYHSRKYDVDLFHIQDPNFSFKKERVIEFCKEIIKRNLKVRWSLPSGIKLETIDEETLEWMKKAGCEYFNFSPESGSKRILKMMNKPVDLDLMLKLIKKASELGIKKGACFIIGYSGENEEDRKLTRQYLKKLVKAGLEEASIYIMCPVPGSRDYETFDYSKGKFKYYEEICWSPKWRHDYNMLGKERKKLYVTLFLEKIKNSPFKTMKHVPNILTGNYELKGEMAFGRMLNDMIKGWLKK